MGLFDNFKKKKKEEESTYSSQEQDPLKKYEQIMQELENENKKKEQDFQQYIEQTEDMLYRMKQIQSSSSATDNLVREELNSLEEEIKQEQALKSLSNKKEIIILYRQKDGNMFPDSVAFIDDNGVIIAGPKDYEGKKIEGLREIKSLDEKTFIVWVGHDAYYNVTPEKILKEFNQDSELYKKIYETSKKGATKCRANEEILYNIILSGLMERIGKYKIVFGNRSARGNAIGHFEEFNKDEENIKTSLISSFAEQLMKFESIPQFYKDIEPELRKIIQLIESNTLTQQQTTLPKINAEFKHTNNEYSQDDDYFLSHTIFDATPPEEYEENYHHHRR